MRKVVRRFKERTLVRYLFVGGTSYALELTTLLLIFYLTDSRTLATAISFWVGFAVAFMLQKIVAFKEYSKEMKALTTQGTLYILLNLWNYIFTIAFVSLFPDRYIILSRTVALIMMASWNYVIYKKIIFKKTVDTPI